MIVGGHLDSVPNGGWLDGALNVVAGARGAARRRRAEPPAADAQAGRLGRRGGRALRAQPAGLERVRRHAGPRRRARPAPTATGSRCPTRSRAHGVDLDRALEARPRGSTAPPPTWSCTSSRARCSSASACRWAWCSAPSASSATPCASPGRTPTPARRRWTSAATPSSPPRAARWPSARTRPAATTCAPRPASCGRAGHRHRLQRRVRAVARPARARRRRCSPTCSPTARRGSRRIAAEEGCEVELGAHLADRADPLRPRAHRHRRRGGRGARRHLAPRCRAARCTTPPRWRACIPTVMLFVKSLRGLSHTKEEDTPGGGPRAVGARAGRAHARS